MPNSEASRTRTVHAATRDLLSLLLPADVPHDTHDAMNSKFTLIAGLGLSIPLLFKARGLVRRVRRSAKLPHNYERVLILGASSGIGRSIAHLYAARGARVCIVGRRAEQLQEVVEECQQLSAKAGHAEYQAGGRRIISVAADFTNVDEMVSVRTALENGVFLDFSFMSDQELTLPR